MEEDLRKIDRGSIANVFFCLSIIDSQLDMKRTNDKRICVGWFALYFEVYAVIFFMGEFQVQECYGVICLLLVCEFYVSSTVVVLRWSVSCLVCPVFIFYRMSFMNLFQSVI